MSNKSEIKKVFEQFGKTDDEAYSVICTVDSVDLVNKTCYCLPLNGMADIMDAALIINKANGFLQVPKVGSLVMVTFQNKSTGYVAMFSELDEIDLNGTTYGGLTKTLELQTQLNKLNAQLQAVITSLSTWVPVPNDGGAALKTFFATQITGKLPGTFTNIENTKVKHGNGL